MRRRLPAPAWKRCFVFILLERRESMNISSEDVYRTLLKDYPDIMGIEEMSSALGVSTKTAYKLLREGARLAETVSDITQFGSESV